MIRPEALDLEGGHEGPLSGERDHLDVESTVGDLDVEALDESHLEAGIEGEIEPVREGHVLDEQGQHPAARRRRLSLREVEAHPEEPVPQRDAVADRSGLVRIGLALLREDGVVVGALDVAVRIEARDGAGLEADVSAPAAAPAGRDDLGSAAVDEERIGEGRVPVPAVEVGPGIVEDRGAVHRVDAPVQRLNTGAVARVRERGMSDQTPRTGSSSSMSERMSRPVVRSLPAAT